MENGVRARVWVSCIAMHIYIVASSFVCSVQRCVGCVRLCCANMCVVIILYIRSYITVYPALWPFRIHFPSSSLNTYQRASESGCVSECVFHIYSFRVVGCVLRLSFVSFAHILIRWDFSHVYVLLYTHFIRFVRFVRFGGIYSWCVCVTYSSLVVVVVRFTAICIYNVAQVLLEI